MPNRELLERARMFEERASGPPIQSRSSITGRWQRRLRCRHQSAARWLSGGKYKMLFGIIVGMIASINSSITDFDCSLMRILIPEQRC